MTVQFNSGEIHECEYAEELEGGAMFLTLKNETMLQAAQLLGSVDLSVIRVSRVKMSGNVDVHVFEGYTVVDFVTTEGTNARAKLKRGST